MPRYVYIAKSQPHRTIQGDIEAQSEQDAVNKLTKMGYFPISVKSEAAILARHDVLGLQKVLSKDIVLFTRQLSTLIESGVNIINGLDIISGQASNKYLKAILGDVITKIKDGKSLSECLAVHRRVFPDLYSSMIRTGEAGGNLGQTLKRLADFLEKEEEFKNSIRASLTYPIFVFSVGALTVLVLLVFVIPRLAAMFADMGQILPLPTRILIGASNFFQNYCWIITIKILIVLFLSRRISRMPQARLSLDRFKLKFAVFGQITLKTEISRLMRTLSLLLSSGIPITSSLEICVSVVENQILKSEVIKLKDQISSGSSLSASLGSSKLFGEFITSIVSIGEETGSLDKSLIRIADDYEREVDRTLKTLTRLLEPSVILIMGLIVGFIVLSMLLPIFQINLIVK